MNVIYHEKADDWGEGYALLQHASKVLEEVLGPTAAAHATAEWDRTEDTKGRLLYTLVIREFSGQEISAKFSWEELRSSSYMRVRLYQIWGDLLHRHSDEHHHRLQPLVH